MKKKIFIIIISLVIGLVQSRNLCSAEDLSLSALSAVVIAADNGKVIYGKDEHHPRPMASTTKIMTSLLALEAAQSEDRPITINDKMVPVEGSSMCLKLGDILPLTSLAKGMLTVSGNDAANSVAISLGGSIEGFAELMNEKARQIGMKDTLFVTPSGLDRGDHHSTAYDMALLGAYAIDNKDFYNISSKRKVEVPFIEPDEKRTLFNENRMLKRYDGCVGIKTGFTKLAGRCLVCAAERNGTRLVSVTLNAGDDWNDHEKLLDYGFSKVETVDVSEKRQIELPLVGGNSDKVVVCSKDAVKLTVDKNEKDKLQQTIFLPRFVYAPISENQILGKIEYSLNGEVLACANLVSTTEEDCVEKNKSWFDKIKDVFKK